MVKRFVFLFCCFFFGAFFLVFATSKNQISLEIIGSYEASVIVAGSGIKEVPSFYGLHYTSATREFGLFVKATKDSTYTTIGDLDYLSGSGTGAYTNFYLLNYTGGQDQISFSFLFDAEGEKVVSPKITISFLHDEPAIPKPTPKPTSSWGNFIGFLSDLFKPQKPEIEKEDEEDMHYVSLGCNYNPEIDFFESEWAQAYAFMKKHGLIHEHEDFCRLLEGGPLTRVRMAEMVALFSSKVLYKQKRNSQELCNKYLDLDAMSLEQQGYAIQACEYGIMGLEPSGIVAKKNFDPFLLVTRAEFGTIISRMILKDKYLPLPGDQWYQNHLRGLYQEGIMRDISNPDRKEQLFWAILMLYRLRSFKITDSISVF